MALFDQRGQHVNTQYNAQQINFGTVQNTGDLITELEKLKEEVTRAQKEGVLDKKKATDVEYQIAKATQEAEVPKPNKKTIINYLMIAKTLLDGFTATGGLVTTIAGAIEAVSKLFS